MNDVKYLDRYISIFCVSVCLVFITLLCMSCCDTKQSKNLGNGVSKFYDIL